MINRDTFPCAGAKAMATLGPDYAPVDRIEVLIVLYQHPETWRCVDMAGRSFVIHTGKLTRLNPVGKPVEQCSDCPLASVLPGALEVSREERSGPKALPLA